jgi:hypothetical protein
VYEMTFIDFSNTNEGLCWKYCQARYCNSERLSSRKGGWKRGLLSLPSMSHLAWPFREKQQLFFPCLKKVCMIEKNKRFIGSRRINSLFSTMS